MTSGDPEMATPSPSFTTRLEMHVDDMVEGLNAIAAVLANQFPGLREQLAVIETEDAQEAIERLDAARRGLIEAIGPLYDIELDSEYTREQLLAFAALGGPNATMVKELIEVNAPGFLAE